MGNKNSAGEDRLYVDDTGNFIFSSDSTVTMPSTVTYPANASVTLGTGSTLKAVTVNATTLNVTGVIVDAALYSKDSAAYPVHLAKVGADGTIYGSGTATKIKELGLVTSAAGVGAGRMLCVSTTDGAIYSIGAGSCY